MEDVYKQKQSLREFEFNSKKKLNRLTLARIENDRNSNNSCFEEKLAEMEELSVDMRDFHKINGR